MTRLAALLLSISTLLSFCLVGPSVSADEDLLLPAVGERVRVHIDTSEAKDVQYYMVEKRDQLLQVEGTLLEVTPESIEIKTDDGGAFPSSFARDRVRAVHVYRGKSRDVVNYAVAGGLTGAILGWFIQVDDLGTLGSRSSYKSLFEEPELDLILLGAVFGSAMGTMIGLSIQYDDWHKVIGYEVETNVTMGYDFEKKQVMLSLRF